MRYALYFSPSENHPLTAAASRWLGRDAFTGETFETPAVAGLSPEQVHALTADPRRYGFHATLKAPFSLKDGASEEDLLAALQEFAASTPAFDIPEVVVGELGQFFAMVPADNYDQLQAFAARVVEHFEPLRAPLSDADLARRKPERLSPQQRTNLERWGYPYVMDEFRFHMTLTGQVPAELSPAMAQELESRFAVFTGRPLSIDAIALFVEPTRGADFIAHRWFPLSPAAEGRKIAS